MMSSNYEFMTITVVPLWGVQIAKLCITKYMWWCVVCSSPNWLLVLL